MLVFEELDPDLWRYMWFGFEAHLDEFIEVLFLVYCARCQPNIQEWFSASTYDLDSHAQVCSCDIGVMMFWRH